MCVCVYFSRFLSAPGYVSDTDVYVFVCASVWMEISAPCCSSSARSDPDKAGECVCVSECVFVLAVNSAHQIK